LPHIKYPRFDLAAVRPGVVHIGLGNFHRAHMARYTHALMAADASALRWGIMGAGLLPADRRIRDALAGQDWLYSLVERDAERESFTLIGSLCGMIPAAEDSARLLDTMVQPETRIVSLTVTSDGYGLHPSSKKLDPGNPTIADDLMDPEHPHSAIGLIVEAYRRRMIAGSKAFSALSCDNIQQNGRVLRQAVLDYAALRCRDLADWIAVHGRFPCTMVDRITPATRAEDIDWLCERYGVEDAAPVFSESFSQWVIEDDFADGRPDWDRVGALFVPDVAPYERMKLRLLNASHLAAAGPARLMGYCYIHDAISDDLICRYVRALMNRETGQTLSTIPGVDLETYKATVIARFANPAICDKVDRVNRDASLNYLLDPLADRLASDQSIDLLGFAIAAWIRRVRGRDERGLPIEVHHPLAPLLRERAESGGSDPAPVLAIKSLFGRFGQNPIVLKTVTEQLFAIDAYGARGALMRLSAKLGF
jgi:mannitol-1-phosphate/altronate dehydrogenase